MFIIFIFVFHIKNLLVSGNTELFTFTFTTYLIMFENLF